MLLRIYILSFISQFTFSTVNRHLKISCGLDEPTQGSVAMRFFIKLRNTGTAWHVSWYESLHQGLLPVSRQLCHKASSKHVGPLLSISRENCEVECIPDKCCLEQGEEEDCDTLQMLGGCFLNVPAGESRTVRLAAPLLDPFERRGYCVVHLHSKLRSHVVFRDRITIPFDTSSESNATPCPQVDQDPFNDCHPVNCDTHYNGQKPHYSRRLKRCLTIPPCPEDVMYNADTNKCVEPIRTRDIRRIKSIVRKKRRRKGNTNAMRSHNTKSNITDSVQETGVTKKMKCFAWNSVGALTFIIFAQCCLVVTLIIWIKKRCKRAKKNKDVVNKFVNRNDSMTTPLLSTNCTLTTCQYKSESSSQIDSKIKSYKAFHKDQTKCTMSDDILTRCLKRRDWTRPKSSDVVPEIKEAEYIHDTMNKIVEKWTKNREFSECDIEREKSVPELPEDVPVERQSEREVKCFDYEEKVQNVYTNIVTVSAQASFTRDSIDDFLSEHGLDYLIGESRYTFSNTSSGASSKKAHVISMHKLGPASDPGGGVSDDLELLHMSRASMFSSSNPSLHTTMKRTKDSRSSM